MRTKNKTISMVAVIALLMCLAIMSALMPISARAAQDVKATSKVLAKAGANTAENIITADQLFTVKAGAAKTATLTANAEGAENFTVWEGAKLSYTVPNTLSMKAPFGAEDSFIESPVMYGAFTTKFLPKAAQRGTADFTKVRFEFVDAIDPAAESVIIDAERKLPLESYGSTYAKIFVERKTQRVGGSADKMHLLWGGFTLETNNINMIKFDIKTGEIFVGEKDTGFAGENKLATNLNYFEDKTYSAFPNGYKVRIYLQNILENRTAELLIEEMSGEALTGEKFEPTMSIDGEFPTVVPCGLTVNLPAVNYMSNSVLGRLPVTVTLTDPDGATASVIEHKFTPTKSGDYVVKYTGVYSGKEFNINKTINVTNNPVFDNKFQTIKTNLGEVTASEGILKANTGVGKVTVTYSLTAKPQGSAATLSGRTFTADKEGSYEITCSLTDEGSPVNVTVQKQTIIAGNVIPQNAFVSNDKITFNSNSEGKTISTVGDWAATISTAGMLEVSTKEEGALLEFANEQTGDFDISFLPLAKEKGNADFGAINILITSTVDSANILKLIIDKDGWGGGAYSFLRTEYNSLYEGDSATIAENQVLYGGFTNLQPQFARIQIINGVVHSYNGETQIAALADLKSAKYEGKFSELAKSYTVAIEFLEIVPNQTATLVLNQVKGQSLSGDIVTNVVKFNNTQVVSKAVVNKPYKLPSAKVSSLFGNIAIENVTCDGVEITDNSFTPTAATEYRFKMKCGEEYVNFVVPAVTDSSDNTVIEASSGTISVDSNFTVAVPSINSKLDLVKGITVITKIEYKFSTDTAYTDITTVKKFSANKIGDYTVKFTARDYNGTETTKEVTIDSQDNTPPVFDTNFTLAGGILNKSYTIALATATDNSGSVTVAILSVMDSSGIIIMLDSGNSFKATKEGVYTVTYQAIDSNENSVTNVCSLTISKDIKKPIITISNQTINGIVGEEITLATVVATDDIDSGLVVTVVVKDESGNIIEVKDNKFTPAVKSKYTVYYSTADESGNIGLNEYTITVKDKEVEKTGCGASEQALSGIVLMLGVAFFIKRK